MTEWCDVAIEDLAAQSKSALATGPFGYAVSKKHFVDEGIPMIRGSNLSTDVGTRLSDDSIVFLSPDVASKFERSMVRNGDLVFTCWGTIGQIGLIDETCRFDRYIVSNKQMKLTPNPELADSRFLYYSLSSPENLDQVQRQAIGSAVPGFNLGQLRQIRILLPDLEIQRSIASVLGAMDDLIENNRRRIEVLEEMAQAIYREWFVHFRYPGHEDAHFVDSSLGPIPDGLDVRPFSEIASFVNGFAFKPAHWSENGRPIIKIKELKNGVAPDTPRCPEAEIKAKYWIEPGDLLFSWSADLGVYRWSGEPGLLNQHLFVVEPLTDVSSLFIQHALSGAIPRFWDRAQGTTMRHIKRSALTEVTAAVPPPHTDRAFADRVAPIDDLAIRLTQASRELASIRNLLLPKLVTGAIDVSALDLNALVEAAS